MNKQNHIIDLMYQNQIAFRKEMALNHYYDLPINDELENEYFNERLSNLAKEKYVGTTKKKYILIGA